MTVIPVALFVLFAGSILSGFIYRGSLTFFPALLQREVYFINIHEEPVVIAGFVTTAILSLGLVGALSIVRFRTPIKEPEELAYLFLAIAMGIGLGANQRVITLIATVVILGLLAIRAAATHTRNDSLFFLNIEVPARDDDPGIFSEIDAIIREKGFTPDIRRMDSRDGFLISTYYVSCSTKDEILSLIEDLSKRIPGSNISFVRQDNLIGL